MRAILRTLRGYSHSGGQAANCCVDCRYFRNDPAVIEKSFPGMSAMGSAYADVRANDGLCEKRGVYLGVSNGCDLFLRAP